MSVPPELLKTIAGGPGQRPTGMGGPIEAAAGSTQPPVGAPMVTPQPKEGEKAAAMVKIEMALNLLETALPPFGSETPEGAAILGALRTLTGRFGEKRQKAKDLVPAEMRQLMASQASSPAQKIMAGGPPPAAPGTAGPAPM